MFWRRTPVPSAPVTEENVWWMVQRVFFSGTVGYWAAEDGSEGLIKWWTHPVGTEYERLAKYAARCGYKIERQPVEHEVVHKVRIYPI